MPIWKLTHRNIPLNSLPQILALRRRKEQFLYMLLSVSEHGYAKINVRGKRQYYDVEEYAVMEKGAIDLTVTLDLERYKAWRRVVVPGDATSQNHSMCFFLAGQTPLPVRYQWNQYR